MGEPGAGRPAGPERGGGSVALPVELICERAAAAIHDDVLQSLALCMLQVELCRRLWEGGDAEAGLAELDGMTSEIDRAAEALRQVVGDLRIVAGHNPRIG